MQIRPFDFCLNFTVFLPMTGVNLVSVESAKILTGLLKFYFLILVAQI